MGKFKKVFGEIGVGSTSSNAKEYNEIRRKSYPPYHHCRKKGHPQFRCWRKHDAKCTKCKQMRHEVVIYKNKNQQHRDEAKTINQEEEEEEDHLFIATYFSRIESSENWSIDNRCNNHMTYNKDLFRELSNVSSLKVRVGNGQYITVKGKGTISISTFSGTKFTSDVLYVPEIGQNLLSVGQLIERGYKVLFENESFLIKDSDDKDIFKVKMRGRSFSLNPLEDEQISFQMQENVTDLWHKRLGLYHH